MTVFRAIQSIMTNTCHDECGDECNRSTLVGVSKARERIQQSRIMLWIPRLLQLSRSTDDHASEMYSQKNEISSDSRQIPGNLKISA